jgi:hypothetical protein
MLTGVSPVLLVADLDRSVAVFRHRLGVQDPDGHDIAFGPLLP